MAIDVVRNGSGDSVWAALQTFARSDGTECHQFARMLARDDAPLRDLADAVHLICLLHGSHPGIAEHAIEHAPDPASSGWLVDVAAAFAYERARLATLIAAAGPLPRTPGQAETEAAVIGQRHALDTLGQSDRIGCAMGAVVALVADWPAISALLTRAADRLGVPCTPGVLPDPAETRALIASVDRSPAVERALLFGAEQLVAQHRGLWDLIEARAHARHPA